MVYVHIFHLFVSFGIPFFLRSLNSSLHLFDSAARPSPGRPTHVGDVPGGVWTPVSTTQEFRGPGLNEGKITVLQGHDTNSAPRVQGSTP